VKSVKQTILIFDVSALVGGRGVQSRGFVVVDIRNVMRVMLTLSGRYCCVNMSAGSLTLVINADSLCRMIAASQ